MTGDTWQHIDARALMRGKSQFGRPHFDRRIYRQRKWGTTQFHRINAQQQMMHDRIANQHNLDHIFCSQVGLFSRTGDQLLQPLNHGFVHFMVTARVHDAIGHPTHQILTKADLRVHRAGRGQHIARYHIAQMCRHSGRAHVDRNPGNTFFQTRPYTHNMVAIAQGDSDLPFTRTQHRL